MRWMLTLLLLLAACSSGSPGTDTTTAATAAPVTSDVAVEADASPETTPMSSPVDSTVGPTTNSTTSSTTNSTTVSIAVTSTTAPVDDDAIVPVGFDRSLAVVTEADGTTCELCVWLATTRPERSRGLMGVTDLGAADAMAFVYPEAHTGSFWMKNTVLPLSIAFFASDGAFLDAFDMEPCVTDDCVTYPTPADFLVAVEVPQGDLPEFGMTAGSTLELLDTPCVES